MTSNEGGKAEVTESMPDKLLVQMRPLADLLPYARNARTHSDEQVAQIAAAMIEWGWTNPILFDSKGIVAGHGRRLAALKLMGAGMPLKFPDGRIIPSGMAPCIDVSGWSDAQRRAYIIADNRLAENADWDNPMLAGDKPHLMVTDPPYGVEYDPSWHARAGVNHNTEKQGKVLNDDRSDWREAWALFPGDVAYVWHASLFTRDVLESLESCGFEHRAMIIWAKDRFTLGRGHYHWHHEPAWYVVRKGATGHWYGDRKQSTLWSIPARDDSGHGHGTQKPVECMRRPIENNSQPDDLVYEPFSGSGTTIIAAELMNRRCLAMELFPAYVDVAVKRWEAFTGQSATLSSHEDAESPTFAEVSASRAGGQATA